MGVSSINRDVKVKDEPNLYRGTIRIADPMSELSDWSSAPLRGHEETRRARPLQRGVVDPLSGGR
jgi:hypothetical protein